MSFVYETKSGQPITFKVYEKDPKDRGTMPAWVVHRVEAYVGGQEAGYLKISYIPKERWDKWFPTVWDMKANKNGWHRDSDSLVDTFRMVLRYTYMHNFNKFESGEYKPTEKEMRDYLKKSEKPYLREYVTSKAFHVDKPMVDFIHVHDEFKRQGVATALYKYGARWLAKTKGMPLYASGLQQPAAKAAWDKMKTTPRMRIPVQEEPHPHDKDKVRTRIDYRKMASRVADRFLVG